MLRRGAEPGLSRIIAVRMSVAAVALSSVLLVVFFARYALDEPLLRRLTLETEVNHIAYATRLGINPAVWQLYASYPHAYAFRVTEIRSGRDPKVVASANAGLLPAMDGDADDFVPGIGSDSAPAANGRSAGPNKWLLTDYDRQGDVVRWIQVAMVGDPAKLWIAATAGEVSERVLFPILMIVPALTLAAFLATRRALRPLTEIGRHAQALADSSFPAGKFAPLPDTKLPQELRSVIGAVNRVLTQLDRSLISQRQFTSDVAHELRTPLAVLLLELSELPPGPAVERFRGELCGLRDIVNELLRFAQAEAAMAQDRVPVDVAAVARRIGEDLAALAFNQRKTIEFDAPAVAVMVAGHATLIDVALRNLVDNAIKAAPRHSTITIGVKDDGAIVVEDCGCGVPDERKRLIFERFWHAGPRSDNGTGIGLALVRRIALLHGGDVTVEDRPGGGARFVLTLAPLRAAPGLKAERSGLLPAWLSAQASSFRAPRRRPVGAHPDPGGLAGTSRVAEGIRHRL